MELGNLVLGERLERKGIALGELFFFFPLGRALILRLGPWFLFYICYSRVDMCPPPSVERGLTDTKRSLKLLVTGVCYKFWDMSTEQAVALPLSPSLPLPLLLLAFPWHMRKGRGVNEMGLWMGQSAGLTLDHTGRF